MDHAALIWDLDGTLVDSYPAIVPAAREVCAELGLMLSEEEIRREVLRSSVGDYLEGLVRPLGLDPAPVKARFNRLNDSRINAIRPMEHAVEALEALRARGCRHFVFTHRGASCPAILEQNGMLGYFEELVTALDGWPRKPSPEGILALIERRGLDSARCFYVGDRLLDMQAAENASIGGILYLPPGSPVSPTGRERLVIRDLLELL